MNHTGPNREPDEARVGLRIARSDEQEDAKGRVDSGDHLFVLMLPRLRRPAARPEAHQRVDEEHEHADHAKSNLQVRSPSGQAIISRERSWGTGGATDASRILRARPSLLPWTCRGPMDHSKERLS